MQYTAIQYHKASTRLSVDQRWLSYCAPSHSPTVAQQLLIMSPSVIQKHKYISLKIQMYVYTPDVL